MAEPAKKDLFFPSAEENILNSYRSYTYNFCLSAISAEAVSNRELIPAEVNKFQIINTAGKGTKGLQYSPQGELPDPSAQSLVSKFNKESPGRFDFYLDNLTVDSLIGSGTQSTGPSQSTQIAFDVYEPYSVGGLYEALKAAGTAAGWSDVKDAQYVLRIQFNGHPDDYTEDNSGHLIPNTTRYFPIVFNEITLSVNDQGSKYRVTATAANEFGFADIYSKLKQDLVVKGTTVREVLSNFFQALNDSEIRLRASALGLPATGLGRKRNFYEVSAPLRSIADEPSNIKGALLSNGETEFQNSKMLDTPMNDGAKSTNNQHVKDASNSDYTQTQDPTVKEVDTFHFSFKNGASINEVISSIILNSKYGAEILKHDLPAAKQGKNNGMIDFWSVRLEVDIGDFDEYFNTYYRTFRYIIEPYSIYYTAIPGEANNKDPMTGIKKIVKRAYNYIYTGKNVDILKFDMKFDKLNYQAMPAANGNITANPNATAESPDNKVQVELPKLVTEKEASDDSSSIATPLKGVDPNLNQYQAHGETAGLRQPDPYYSMAIGVYDSIVNSAASLYEIDLTIIGDPYYLINNANMPGGTQLKETLETTDGQAPVTQGDVYINLNFKSPNDFNSGPGGDGLLLFDENRSNFSGIYKITTVKNKFNGGQFIQDIHALKVYGELIKGNKKLTPDYKTKPDFVGQVVPDSAKGVLPGFRPSTFNLSNLLNVSGANIPVNLAGVSGLSGTLGNLVGGGSNISATLGAVTKSLGTDPTAVIKSIGSNLESSAGALAANVGKTISGIGSKISSVVGDSSGLIGGVSDKVTTLQNSLPSDPNALASKMGIDPSAISGVGSNFESAITDKLSGMATSLQNTVNLPALQELGVAFGSFAESKLKNLPAFQPKAKAVFETVNFQDAANITKGVDLTSIVGSNPTIPGIDPVTGVTDKLASLGAGSLDLNATQSFTDKIGAAAQQATQLGGQLLGMSANMAAGLETAVQGISAADVGLGSVESQVLDLQSITKNSVGVDLSKSAASVLGSRQTFSPLKSFVTNNSSIV